MNFIHFIGRHEHFCKMKKKKNTIRFLKEDNEEFMLRNSCFGAKIGWFLELFHYLSEKNFIAKDF